MSSLFMTGAAPDEVWPLVRDFHYSKRMPSNIQHCYAVRGEGGLFGDSGAVVAAAIFNIPGTRWSEEVIELARLVRSPDYAAPLSQLLAFACDRLRKNGWNLVVSFADWTQKHHGGIYQASGWQYDGQRDRQNDGIIVDGVFVPGRSANSRWGTRSAEKLRLMMPNKTIEPHFDEGKHLYWRPLVVSGRTKAKRLGLRSISYPKPNAAGPLDAPVPTGASWEHPPEAAPNLLPIGEVAA
jgi:hypothetical protein